MMLQVFWTKTGVKSLQSIENYFLKHFTEKEFNVFLEIIEKTISLIKKGNLKHKFIKRTNTYKVILKKKSSMYYKIKDEKLIITAIWDNRMMKGKNRFE